MGEEEKKGVERNKNKWEIFFYRKMPASNCKVRKPSNAIIDSGKDHQWIQNHWINTAVKQVICKISKYQHVCHLLRGNSCFGNADMIYTTLVK